jgi:hypothetical protein
VSYRLCKKDYETEEEASAQQRAVEPLMHDKIGSGAEILIDTSVKIKMLLT